MKKLLTILFFCLISLNQLTAQELTQIIRGQVLDEASSAPLIGATIAVISTNPLMGAATDVQGNFVIRRVPIGRHTIKISSIGYEDVLLSEVLVNSAKQNVLNIKLRESIKQIAEITITPENEQGKASNELATVSARSLSVEDAKNYAASVNDPSRAALSFAGVTTNDDENNEIIIRGNSPRNILWRVEGIEVSNPNHFAGNNGGGGGISILSVNVLDNSDFFTGAFPAEYGNGTSGVFDLKLRKGNSFEREHAFQVGLLGLDFAVEGPFKKNSGKASYLINYRYSTLGILDGLGLVTDFADVIPNFQDLSFKIHLPTEKAGTFSVWGFGGLSEQKDRDPSFPSTYGSDLGVGGLSHKIFLGENTFLESGLIYSHQQIQDVSQDLEFDESFEGRFTNRTIRAKLQINHKFNAKFSLRGGVIGSYKEFDASEKETFGSETFVTVDEKGDATIWQSYAQGQYRLTENLELNLGVHALYFALNETHSIEPRAGLKWNFRPQSSLSLGYGRHSRVEALNLYFARDLLSEVPEINPNRNLELSKADHFVIGYDQFFAKNWHLRLETYYQRLSDIPIARMGVNEPELLIFSALNLQDGFVNIPLVSEGTGENYGLELTLERFFTDGWYLLTTFSWFDSEYKGADGIQRDTRYNFDFASTFLAGKEFKMGKGKNNSFGLNARVLWNGGPRFLPIDLETSRNAGFTVRDYSRGYALNSPNYFRADFRINYRLNRPKFAAIISLDIQNITGRANVFNYFYSRLTDNIEPSEQLGLVPVLNFRMEF